MAIKKGSAHVYKDGNWYDLLSGKAINAKTIPQVKYSSNRIEIGTWIDGRKIYRKVYSGSGNVPKDLQIDKHETIIDMRMIVKNKGNNGSWRTIPWLYDPSDKTWLGGFYVNSEESKVIMQLGNNLSDTYWWHLIIDYCIDKEA
nr:MAG TPA: hypothetical protein [Caudoviricetes sp.]